MYKTILDAKFLGWQKRDPAGSTYITDQFHESSVVLELKNSSFLVFTIPECVGQLPSLRLLTPQHGLNKYRALGKRLEERPVPNVQAGCSSLPIIVHMAFFTVAKFTQAYPSSPLSSSSVVSGVFRVSLNGQSFFFTLSEQENKKLRDAQGLESRQRWSPIMCKPLIGGTSPVETDIEELEEVLNSHYVSILPSMDEFLLNQCIF